MAKWHEYAMNISAKLDSTYGANFRKANQAIGSTGNELLELGKIQKNISKNTKLKENLVKTSDELRLASAQLEKFKSELKGSKKESKSMAIAVTEAEQEVRRLSYEFDKAKNPTKMMSNTLEDSKRNLKKLTQEQQKSKTSTTKLSNSVNSTKGKVDRLNRKLKKENEELGRVRKSLSQAGYSTTNLAKANDKVSRSMDIAIKKQKTLNKIRNTAGKIFNPMVGAAAGVLSVGVAISKANESIAKASSYNEIQTKFDQVFKSYGKTANNWADNYAKTMNMSIVKTKESMGDIQNLFTGFGMDRGVSFEMSTNIIQLANDLDSFNDLTNKGVDAQKTMISALMGETEAAKTLGASILESNLQVAAAELGYDKYSSKMDEATKIQIRFKAIQMQSKDAIGDVARNLESEVGLTRKKNALLEKQQLVIGNGLLPVRIKWLNLQIKSLTFMNEHFDTIVATTQVLGSLAAGYGAMKIVGTITTLIQGKTKAEILASTVGKTLTAVQTAYNVALTANPIGVVVGALVALVGIGYVVYKNFDTIKVKTLELWDTFKQSPIYKVFEYSPLGLFIKGIQKLYGWYKKFKGEKRSESENLAIANQTKINSYASGNNATTVTSSGYGIPKYAKGGVVSRPHLAVVGDGKTPESIIPHDGSERSRGLWADAGKKMGLLNESRSSSRVEIHIDFSPTIQGESTNIMEALRKEGASLTELIKTEVEKTLSNIARNERRVSFD